MLSSQRAWTLGLLCFGVVLSALMARRWLTPAPSELAAAISMYDVSADELYAQPGFAPHPGAPQTWSQISLHYQRDPAAGTYQKFLRCRLRADEVRRTNRSFFSAGAPHRTADDLPPRWWSQTAVPTWFTPAGIGQWRMDQHQRGWLGQYLAFAPDADAAGWGTLYLWEWLDPVPPSLPLAAPPFGLDALAQDIGQQLLAQHWPVRADGWLEAPGRTPPPQWREQVPQCDVWLQPALGWYALRLRAVTPGLSDAALAEGWELRRMASAELPLPENWPLLPVGVLPVQASVVRDPITAAPVRVRWVQRLAASADGTGAMVLVGDWRGSGSGSARATDRPNQ